MNEKHLQKNNFNLFLTGFMGSGKSTVGELLSEKLGRRFFDLDSQIEDYLKLSLEQIIEKFGVEYFRKIESQKLAVLCSQKNAVIALGGGTLIATKNLKQVLKAGHLIYLMTPEDVILDRLKKTQTRPLFKKINHKTYRKLFEERVAGYMKADLCVQTNDHKPDRVCSMVLSQIKELQDL